MSIRDERTMEGAESIDLRSAAHQKMVLIRPTKKKVA